MKKSALIFIVPLLHSCSPVDGYATYVPTAAASVTRTQAVASAYAYTQVRWTPTEKNVKHQQDSAGIIIHTPDQSLKEHDYPNGWWKVGTPQAGMPYMWGGFDTPASFLEKLASGHAAGDIATSAKRSGGDKLVSSQATGIDCSGLISRCWRLPRAYSTAELPQISDAIEWRDLQAGDILLNDRHVLLFSHWGVPGSTILPTKPDLCPSGRSPPRNSRFASWSLMITDRGAIITSGSEKRTLACCSSPHRQFD